jgi:hypothetical protein
MKNRIAYSILTIATISGLYFGSNAKIEKDLAISTNRILREQLETLAEDKKVDTKILTGEPIYFTDTETAKFYSFWATILGLCIGVPSFTILLISFYYSISKDQSIYAWQKLTIGLTKKGFFYESLMPDPSVLKTLDKPTLARMDQIQRSLYLMNGFAKKNNLLSGNANYGNAKQYIHYYRIHKNSLDLFKELFVSFYEIDDKHDQDIVRNVLEGWSNEIDNFFTNPSDKKAPYSRVRG